MGIISGLMGNASGTDIEAVKKDYGKLLGQNEQVVQAYQWIRDLMIFTDYRLIMVDIQGATGKKVNYHSVPYKSIRHFEVESAGHFDLEAELKIWVADMGTTPLVKTFSKDADVYKVQALLAECIVK
ncbi:PH domain-containing protein [Anaerovibrio sp.]|uniref:PH domain-containing protein n=1 Tax=Anaerovibrio sp. TaxID=1872532 RepID=UPI001B7552C6|nr:PH domain-containing protein [Anaerovibrio sp.]MBP3231367.1 PH domain-containing protein [Anaerovibrio sp.]MBR2143236.1 PH domain-containing protein [Anaerovibrio sp.]